MSGLENRLAAIGYRIARRSPDRWRVERIGRPSADRAHHITPLHSRALSLWLKRLGARANATPYRICLASEVE